jgi:type I restriction enzyme R subunit
VTRRARAEKLRQKKANFLNQYTPAARQILEALLEKYADYGVGQFDEVSRLLQVPPISAYGSANDIYGLFGGPAGLLQAVDKMQKFLYE